MPSPSPQLPSYATSDLFSREWLTSEPLRLILNAAPVGVVRLQSRRNQTGEVVDFTYDLVNPILEALAKQAENDMQDQSLIELTPDVVKTGMLTRLIDVVNTGLPRQCAEEYRLDGIVSRFNQLYVRSGDGVLILVQDVSYQPLATGEQQQQTAFMAALVQDDSAADLRAMLIQLISGQKGKSDAFTTL
ncbi:hypothetical protein ACAW74_21110 [Fibrella sp. WM1]|uniref:hypothetical protein n=1 Tax=Fibrella musci TaxID=3242485 RepID=UPI00352155D2